MSDQELDAVAINRAILEEQLKNAPTDAEHMGLTGRVPDRLFFLQENGRVIPRITVRRSGDQELNRRLAEEVIDPKGPSADPYTPNCG